MFEKLKHRTDSVSVRPQKEDACVASRWVEAKIREPLVRGDEKSSLLLDRTPKGRVLPTAHSLLPYSRYLFVPRSLEESGYRTREIFVDLEEHQPSLLYAVRGSRLSWCKTSAA